MNRLFRKLFSCSQPKRSKVDSTRSDSLSLRSSHNSSLAPEISDPDAAENTPVSKPPVDFFQLLPPEVRDLIYEQLLDARYTRLKRRTLHDPAYKFHTNILRVSRAIHAEAEHLLYERNIFVTASHVLDMDDFDQLIMQRFRLWVPIVTWEYTISKSTALHEAGPMKHSSLQIDFAHSSDGLSASSVPTDRTTLRARTCVFLIADLESYCSVLSERMHNSSGPSFHIYEGGLDGSSLFDVLYDETGHLEGRLRPPASLALTLRSTIYREFGSRLTSLTPLFLRLIAPSLRVSIHIDRVGHLKVLDRAAMEMVRRHMGPSLAYTEAVNWASFERYETRKAIADSTALGGELDLALAMYEDMRYRVSLVATQYQPDSIPLPPGERCPAYAFRLLEADMYMTKAHLHYKLRDRAAFKATVKRAFDNNCLLDCYLRLQCDFAQQPGTLDWIMHLISMAHLDGDVVDGPLRCVDLRRTADFARKPEFIVGWLDVKDLSQTSEAHRSEINAQLLERGLPPTRFSEIDEMMKRLSS
jgi:hypothetical protein